MFTRKSDACCYDYEFSDLINLNCEAGEWWWPDSVCVCLCLCVFLCGCVSRGELAEDFTDSLSIQGRSQETNPAQTIQVPFNHFFSIVIGLIGSYASIPSSDSLSVQGRLPESEAAVSLWKWKAAVKRADRWPGERDWIAQVNVSFYCLHHACYDKEDKVCLSLHREKKEGELTGDRYKDLDWQKISNIDVG